MKRKFKPLQRDEHEQGWYKHLLIVTSPYGNCVDTVFLFIMNSLYFFLKFSLILCFKNLKLQTNSTLKLNEIKHKFPVTVKEDKTLNAEQKNRKIISSNQSRS